jgi:hypothetical protein
VPVFIPDTVYAGGFYVGIFNLNHAARFDRCCISVNRLVDRVSWFQCGKWMMDSGAFTELARHGHYRHSVADYAFEIRRWASRLLVAAVSQDYMCEPFVLKKTGLTVREHQLRTVRRYERLLEERLPVHIMPVLQGYEPGEYVRHIRDYRGLLPDGSWVGVGSICKRNSKPAQVLEVLDAVRSERPDLRLHGFGLKISSLVCPEVLKSLYSSDSMAWSFAGRRRGDGSDANRVGAAIAYVRQVEDMVDQVRSRMVVTP